MPRNPNTPHEPHKHCRPVVTPISTTENIKLQLVADKLEAQLKEEFITKEGLKTINGQTLYGEGDIKLSQQDSATAIKIGATTYTPTEGIVELPNFITNIPTEYVTETELENKGYLTEHQDLSDYAKKEDLFNKDYNELLNKPNLFSGKYEDLLNKPEIPSILGLASEKYVDNKVAEIKVPTKVSELDNDANYITDLSNYYTKSETEDFVKDEIAKIDIPEIKLDGYATEQFVTDAISKIEIPTVTGLATELYVDNAIANIKHPTVDLTEYAKKDEIPTDYVKKSELEGYSKFSGSYNDLTDKPNLDDLASKAFVETVFDNAEVQLSEQLVEMLENASFDGGEIK